MRIVVTMALVSSAAAFLQPVGLPALRGARGATCSSLALRCEGAAGYLALGTYSDPAECRLIKCTVRNAHRCAARRAVAFPVVARACARTDAQTDVRPHCAHAEQTGKCAAHGRQGGVCDSRSLRGCSADGGSADDCRLLHNLVRSLQAHRTPGIQYRVPCVGLACCLRKIQVHALLTIRLSAGMRA